MYFTKENNSSDFRWHNLFEFGEFGMRHRKRRPRRGAANKWKQWYADKKHIFPWNIDFDWWIYSARFSSDKLLSNLIVGCHRQSSAPGERKSIVFKHFASGKNILFFSYFRPKSDRKSLVFFVLPRLSLATQTTLNRNTWIKWFIERNNKKREPNNKNNDWEIGECERMKKPREAENSLTKPEPLNFCKI